MRRKGVSDDSNYSKALRPKLIIAAQNWGSGAFLDEPLKALSKEFSFDIYQYYPVVTQFKKSEKYPLPNDKRLGEMLKGK